MDQLSINLFGGFAVALDEQPVTQFRSAKARALLAYLATQPDQEHNRMTLATLLWGDLGERAARTNLRIELSNLKRVLMAHPALVITRNTVRVDGALLTVDVVGFRETVRNVLALPPETQVTQLAQLAQALEWYRGEFLAGFQLDEAIAFDDWRLLTQETLHEQAMHALETLQRFYSAQGNWRELAGAARRQLALVPWLERAHRNLIQALAAQGQRQAALDQYTKCRELLRVELGVEPAVATQELVTRLRHNEPITTANREAFPRHNLPNQQKSIVGRANEIARLHQLVQTAPLVTLLGMGGVGKSRLAQAVGQDALRDFPDGVWFVPLAMIEATASAPERIALAIATAIGFPITNAQQLLAELTTHLAHKTMLLILDNWDHLVSAAETLFAQLQRTSVHVLATSRVRLLIENEVQITVDGLSADVAFDLFVQRAQRILPSFAVADADKKTVGAINRICTEVAGLPLGIELAASWVEHFSVAEIGQSLAAIVVAPESSTEHFHRHQTLERIFEYSWQLLSREQQPRLARLAIFLGGFDRAAATAVAASNFSTLSLLIAHSLVQRVAAGRYDLHPVVREFAEKKLLLAEIATLQAKHSEHYLAQLVATFTEIPERELPNQATPGQDAASLQQEFANIRSAWQHAVEAGMAELLAPAMIPFANYMDQFGYLPETYQLFDDAVHRFITTDLPALPERSAQREFVAQLLYQQWRCSRSIHGLYRAEPFLQRLIPLTTDPVLLVKVYIELATMYAELNRWTEAEQYFTKLAQIAEHATDPELYARAIECPIHIQAIHFRGDYSAGIDQLTALLSWLDALPPAPVAKRGARMDLRMQLLGSLSLLAIRYGDYGLAIHAAQQNMAMLSAEDRSTWKSWFLLDLALAEQFAGLYAAAIAHNQESLAMAEESGAIDDIGLLKANLCLTMRQGGDLATGLRYGLEAIPALSLIGLTRMEGQARNRVGHTLAALGRWQAADDAYDEALTVWAPLHHPNRYEAVAGRAVTRYQLGFQAEALTLVQEVLGFVEADGLGKVVEPVLLLLNCAAVLSGCGNYAAANQVLAQANQWVQTIAARISDEAVRSAFLAKPDHQRLAEQYKVA